MEMSVEKLSSHIDDLRHTKAQKKNHLNLLYNKYELVTSELQLFLLELEDKKNLDLTILGTDLIVTEKEKANLLEERKRLEEDLTRNLLADKRKKVTKEDLRDFKKQFKESVAFYDIWGYNKSTDNRFLRHQEELWKNLLWEYNQLAQKAFTAQEYLHHYPDDANHKEELQFLNHKLNAMEARIRNAKENLDHTSSELGSIYKDLGIPKDRQIDKGYFISEDDMNRMLLEDNPDRRKVALAYLNYKIHHEDKEFLESVQRETYTTLFGIVQRTVESAINEFDCEGEPYLAVHQEYMMSGHVLCRLTTLEEHCYHSFDGDTTQKLFAELFSYFNAHDEAVAFLHSAARVQGLASVHGSALRLAPLDVPRPGWLQDDAQ